MSSVSSASSSIPEPVGPRSQSSKRKVAFAAATSVADDAADGDTAEESMSNSEGHDAGDRRVESESQNEVRFVLVGHESEHHASPIANSRCTSPTTTCTTDSGCSILDTISSLWHSEGPLLQKFGDAWDQGNSFTRGSMIGAAALLLGGLALGSAYLGTRMTDYDFGHTPPSSPPRSIAMQGDNDITQSLVDRLDEIRGWASDWRPSAASDARSAAASVGSVVQQASQAASGWYGSAISRFTDLDGSVLGIVRDRWS